MQPRFALRIYDDGLSLLDRTAAGWAEVGSAAFDGPDLDAAVAALVAEASARAPKGFSTLLVLPDSQVLYTQVEDAGADADTQRDRIGAALEGRTPYDLADLVFDWTMQGTTAHVAVVARETLDEAEGFAAARGLNPIGFAASPAAGIAPAVASFGTTALAATLLKRGRTLAPETAPVVALVQDGADAPDTPREDPAPQPEPEPQPDPAPQEEPDPAPLPEPPPPTPTEVPEPPPESEPQPEPLPIPLREPEPVGEPEPLPVPAPDPGPDPTPDPVPEPLDVPGFDPMPEPVTMQQPSSGAASVLDPGIAEVDEAPIALDVPTEAEPVRPRPLAAALPIDDVPPAPSAAASLAFASRRDVAASVSATAPRAVGAASRPIAAPAAKPATPRVADRPVERPAGLRPAPKLGYADPVEPKEARGLRGLGAFVTAPVLPGRAKRKALLGTPAPAASPAPATAATPASAAARPAAKAPEFRGRPSVQRGKPKYLGLILTGVLLVFLAIAAALSSYFVTDADPAADAQSAPATEGTETQAAAAPVAPAPVTPAPVTPTVVTPTPASPAPEAATAPQAVADAGPAPAEGEPAAAAPVVDATDMAATVAPDSGTQDEITLSSAETAPQALDAVALPVPGARGDPPPAAQVPPPPFGTVYQFDENGLIRPTPEGIVSPEGVLLVAGRPAQVPPPRPEGLAPAPAADAAAAAPEAATGFPADPALADARPQARPAGLAPAPAPEPAPETATQAAPEDETNLIPAAARFVSLRPPARPDAILAAGLQAQQAALAASASLAAPDPNRSVLALSVSRRPAARPADMARAVEAAVAAAARQPEPEPEPEPAPEPDPPAEITPETEEEPELAGAAPAIPATANVARQATMRNVIDLGDLNLIGIYGTQSDRYALVRQPNGRFVKVRVGDRLDGGRVAAITASEVRYEKRGRMQVLEMPRG